MLLFIQNSALSDDVNDFSVFPPDKILNIRLSDIIQIIKEPAASSYFFIPEGLTENHLKKIIHPLYILNAAGGLILNEKEEILMIFRRGHWDLPKGKKEQNESLENSALRECSEETGLKSLNLKKFLTVTHHLYPYIDGYALKTTHWYEFYAPSCQTLVPQTFEDITEVRWMNFMEIKNILHQSYRMIEYLIRKYYLIGKE